jgi:NhaA family Na+:H+ antiporter
MVATCSHVNRRRDRSHGRVYNRPWPAPLNHWKWHDLPARLAFPFARKRPRMKRYLPVAIVLAAFLGTLGAGALLYHFRRPPGRPATLAAGKPGAEPPHIRGPGNAPVTFEEFGDFECLPCFVLWPAMKNIEKDYDKSVSVTFRQHPLAQHTHARDAACAAEAAGLQGRFWEMHDMLYLRRAKWIKADDVRAFFNTCATELGLDLAKFAKDMEGAEVAKRIAADEERGASLDIDRTPVVFINGKRIEFSPQPEEGLRAEIDAVLGAGKR